MAVGVNDLDKIPFYRLASVGGTAAGATSMTGDYSTTQEEFYIEAKKGEILSVARCMVFVRDTGSFDADKYGNDIELTNGIAFFYEKNGIKSALPYMITTNVGWGVYCYDFTVSSFGIGDESMAVRWSFDKLGAPITLYEGDKLGVRLHDSFTGLNEHLLMFEGVNLGAPSIEFANILEDL